MANTHEVRTKLGAHLVAVVLTDLHAVDCRHKVGGAQRAGELSEVRGRGRVAGAPGDGQHCVDDVKDTAREGHIRSRHTALAKEAAGKNDAVILGLGLDDLAARHVGVRGVGQESRGKDGPIGDLRSPDGAAEDVVLQDSRDETSVRGYGSVHLGGEERVKGSVVWGQDGDV